MQHEPAPVLALAGGSGSGKTTLARALAHATPGSAVLHLDLCFHTDPAAAPTVPAFEGSGRVVDFSDPRSIDETRVQAEIARHSQARLLIIEGTFALALPYIRQRARWTAYVDAPADIRIVRKALRKIREGKDPETTLRGYLEQSRAAHDRHVEPSRTTADLVLDGTAPTDDLVRHLTHTLELTVSAETTED